MHAVFLVATLADSLFIFKRKQQRHNQQTRVYYKEAVAAFVVFDVTRIATFEAASKWKADIDDKVTVGQEEKPIPVVLLANKADLAKDGLPKSAHELDEFCETHGFAGWFETSAKENIGIDKAAKHLIQRILDNTYTTKGQDDDLVDVNSRGNAAAAGDSGKNPCCPF